MGWETVDGSLQTPDHVLLLSHTGALDVSGELEILNEEKHLA